MSKSTGNYVGIQEPPEEQFGKVMSVPDSAMGEYYDLLFPEEPGPGSSAVDDKRRLGRLVVDRFHGPGAGERAEDHFNRVVRDREAPDDMPEHPITGDSVHVPALLVEALGVASRSEARRLLTQGAVSLDGERTDALDLDAGPLDGVVLKAGKRRFCRLRLDRPPGP